MRRHALVVCAALISAAGLVPGAARPLAQSDAASDQEVIARVASSRPDLVLDHMATAGPRGYVVLQPVPVAGPHVREGTWSPDGRYALLVREPPRTSMAALQAAVNREPVLSAQRRSLVLWNRQTGRAQEVWTAPLSGGDVEEVRWLPGSRVALVVVAGTVSTAPDGTPLRSRALLRVDAATGTARSLLEAPPDETADGWLSLDVSPLKPIAILWLRRMSPSPAAPEDGLALVGPAGLGPAIAAPNVWPRGTLWAEDGSPVLRFSETAPEPRRPRPVLFAAIDAPTGALRRLPAEPTAYHEAPPALPIRLATGYTRMQQGASYRRVQQVWLQGDTGPDAPRALVCADADWAELSPTGDVVLFCSQGTASACTILRVSAQAVAEARRAALKSLAMHDGKQVGLGLMMWSQDNDERLPGQSEFSASLIGPYLKDTGVADRFVYTFPGGNLSDVAAPAETEMGYVPGPGGRAILYVDGHVKWRPD